MKDNIVSMYLELKDLTVLSLYGAQQITIDPETNQKTTKKLTILDYFVEKEKEVIQIRLKHFEAVRDNLKKYIDVESSDINEQWMKIMGVNEKEESDPAYFSNRKIIERAKKLAGETVESRKASLKKAIIELTTNYYNMSLAKSEIKKSINEIIKNISYDLGTFEWAEQVLFALGVIDLDPSKPHAAISVASKFFGVKKLQEKKHPVIEIEEESEINGSF